MADVPSLETWMLGVARANIADARSAPHLSSALDRHIAEVHQELVAAGAPINRASLTLYVHAVGLTAARITASTDDWGPSEPGTTQVDWPTLRITAVCAIAEDYGVVPAT
jgi:hypothetical protein